MTCRWCKAPLDGQRRDARFCSQRCRQAAHRFRATCTRRERAERPLTWRYADPPYPGLAKRYYGDEPEFAGEVDHRDLLSRLAGADGWALSTSAHALPFVCSLLRLDGLDLFDERGRPVRVATWRRGARPGASTRPRSSWEPVLFAGGRGDLREDWTPDTLDCTARARSTEARTLVGAKPAAFWFWLFELLGATPGDTFEDLFPGTGAGRRAWDVFSRTSGDVSRGPRGDVSGRAADDVSRGPRGDVSIAGEDDVSRSADRDRSLDVLHNAGHPVAHPSR